MSVITGSAIVGATGVRPTSGGGAYASDDGALESNVSRQTGVIEGTDRTRDLGALTGTGTHLSLVWSAHHPTYSEVVEPFDMGVVAVDSVEPFDIAQANSVVNSVEPFDIAGNATASSVEPFNIGANATVISVEPFTIYGPDAGGVFADGSPASPQIGWWSRT